MIFIVTLAFVAIIASLGLAMYYMLKGGNSDATASEASHTHEASDANQRAKARNMSKALALRVGLSIALFLCILISWQLGWIEPTGIKAGQ
jgi:hypothetical protein